MILIVDDDVAMAETCAMLLESHGYDVSTACSGAEALDMMHAGPHDLLISDFAMPGMTGLELSEQIRAAPATAHLPILLMSASRRCEIAHEESYDAFLRKPFLAEDLVGAVRKLLAPVPASPVNFLKV